MYKLIYFAPQMLNAGGFIWRNFADITLLGMELPCLIYLDLCRYAGQVINTILQFKHHRDIADSGKS